MTQEVLVPIPFPPGHGIHCFPGLRMGLSRCDPVALSHDPAPPRALAVPTPWDPCPSPTAWGFLLEGNVWDRFRSRCLVLLALLRSAVGIEPSCRQLSALPQHPRGAGESGEHLAPIPAARGVPSIPTGAMRGHSLFWGQQVPPAHALCCGHGETQLGDLMAPSRFGVCSGVALHRSFACP